MAYTCKSFVDSLGDLTVTGVVRKYDAPPEQINAADLPILYPRLPVTQSGAVTFGARTGMRVHQAELVIVLKANNQSRTADKHAEALTMLDNLHTALAAAAGTLGLYEWSVAVDEEVFGDGVHWVCVATIEGRGT